jgi:hypothetical protein
MKLQIAVTGLLLAVAPHWLHAQPWEFSKPVAVTSTYGEKIFHHLESSGRRNIAVSGDAVAMAWEDEHDGTPRIYLARKDRNKQEFSKEVRISGNGEAYEPSLLALTNNRFVLAWEEDARIHLRVVTPTELGPIIKLGEAEAGQASLASHNQHVFLVYSKREGRYGRIWMRHIEVDGHTLRLKQACAVDAEPARDEQLYPTVASVADRVIVAWEDRRPGHTIIMAAQNEDMKSCKFGTPQRVSAAKPGNRPTFGKGHGVSRVALAPYGAGKLLATWADKRDFREGYDIYAAQYQPGNKQLFGANIKIQDSFGSFAQQWHATVAGDTSGRVVVGWDDNRDGNANIMLSWPEGDGWSDDYAVPGADGPGQENHPTITLDREGNLHLAWIERSTIGGPTRVRYLFGKVIKRTKGVRVD